MVGEQLQFGDDERLVMLRRGWDRALHSLAAKVNKVTFESYIKPIRPLAMDGQEVTLGVASPFAREWLDKRYAALIREALEAVFASPIQIRFSILPTEPRAHAPEPIDAGVAVVADANSAAPDKTQAKRTGRAVSNQSLPLNDRYTFDSFIVGKSNRLAHAAAVAVAASPGTIYNPLFLYGGPGLGKTHVLHSIGHAVSAAGGKARVALIDGENFTYHYVTSLRERKTEEFRRHFRNIDVWLVDDIQFIAGAERTKEEFFHTFNALYQTGKQIVIASDRSPRELRAMDERLRSRFECGLVADIGAPDLETRMAILDRRCESENWKVEPEVIYYIASSIRSNIRALEGALTKLIAYSSIMRSPISIDLAQSVLSEYLIEKPLPGTVRKGIGMETILAAVADQFSTTVEAIRGERRDRSVITARQVAMYLCREMTGSGLAQIGAAFGGREHTTVQRAVAKVEGLLKQDSALQVSVSEARERLDR